MSSGRPVDLIATIPSRPGEGARVLALLQEYAVHVNATPGTERFEVYADRDNPDVIVVIERYRDDAAFAEHIADPANGVLNASLAELTLGGSQLQFLVTD
ncbi:MAG: antibiotic biosynthesis monooxygenase [Propioniciclava sp.]|uniref:putative quinol monooxygenase n=1 Tax=Propioniciclava sp. TaxID=2038686 RepID=UPI0039E648BE